MSAQPLTIVQLNMGRASAVSDQLLEYCQNNEVDVALVQEPYTNRGRLVGFEVAPFRCYLSKPTRRRGGPLHLDYGAAIIVFNPNLVVVARDSGLIENFVSIDIDCAADGIITMVSGYFKFRVPTAIHVEALDRIFQSITNEVLIALDANAFSTRWFSRINDRRGETLTTWLDEHDLHTVNTRSQFTTYNGPRGRTNIDVTISGQSLLEKIVDWKVVPDVTTSDHRVLRYTLHLQLRLFVHRATRFNLDQRKRDAFVLEFARATALRDDEHDSLDSKAQHLHEDITAAAELFAPRRNPRKKVVPPWWSPQLTRLRKEVRIASRRCRQTGDRVVYNSKRNEYTQLLRSSKVASWRRFCTLEGKHPWGKLYRWMKGNKAPVAIGLMKRADGSLCQDIDESVTTLLNVLIPNDPTRPVGARNEAVAGNLNPFSCPELKALVWTIAPNRAPGTDGITGSMVRALWPTLAPRLLCITNECLARARFPESWKVAQVVPILKGKDKDVMQPKSYRPVSLLPVLGKVIEKAINLRLQEQITPSLTGRQYGFTRNRSTFDAFQNLLTWSDLRQERHVLTIFLDITGAFDNLEWTALQRDLQSLGASNHIRSLIADYLGGRTAKITIGGVEKSVRLTKGCPQGSILGPVLWNVTMEALLRVKFPEHVNIQAYADDIAVSVAAPNRRILIERAEETLIPVLAWAEERGLKFSAQKSVAMTTKGDMVPGFTLAFGEERIATVDCVKYLGIRLDQKRQYTEHLDDIRKASETIFTKMRGTLGSGWGMKRENIAILYRGVFLPKIAYGARFWAHKTTSNRAIKLLGSIQRRALIGMTGAYCTTSTDALQILAGVPPLDLEIRWMVLKAEAATIPNNLRPQTLANGREELLDAWQARWAATQNGRWTYRIFPEVRKRLKLPLALGHEVTQFLSGHGNFRAKLAGFDLQPTPLCVCGDGEEDVAHVLFDCALHIDHRAHLELAVHRSGYLWPCDPAVLVSTKSIYCALVKFAKTAAYLERTVRA